MNWTGPASAILYLVVGVALGAAYFALLRREVELLFAQASAVSVIPLHLLRVGLAIVAFWAVAQQGALALLLALLGFLVARTAARRWLRPA
jgi:F1F0 ATPase subunit 2